MGNVIFKGREAYMKVIGVNKYGLDIANFRIFDFNVLATHGDKDKPGSIIDKLSLYFVNGNEIKGL